MIALRFIEERSFVSDMDMAGLAFFDECTERVEEENGRKICVTYNFLYSCIYILININLIIIIIYMR